MNAEPSDFSLPSARSAAAGALQELEALLTEPGDTADAQLVDRARKGDMQAFEELITRYRGRVYGMTLNMTGSDADARDLSQEVFIKAWRALPGFEARAQFFTWIYRITQNVVIDWSRKRRIRPGTEFNDELAAAPEAAAVTVPHGEVSPDRALENRELGKRIREALAQLTPEHRAVVLLKEVDGLSYQEIADTVGCAIGTVMSRLFNARKKLQELLKDVYPARGRQPSPV